MYFDTHCHIDLFDDPIATARAYERANATCVMATLLPSHYKLALPHVEQFRYIHPALGMHPLRASAGATETGLFSDLACSTNYIGEIGLDFSREGRDTKEIQLNNFRAILPAISNGRFVTVHSRNAHEEVAHLLEEHHIGPVCFHYFIGGPRAAVELAANGHYFSINNRMLKSKHRSLVDSVPRDRILVETDGPFLTKRPLVIIERVYNELSNIWHCNKSETVQTVARNFGSCQTAFSKCE